MGDGRRFARPPTDMTRITGAWVFSLGVFLALAGGCADAGHRDDAFGDGATQGPDDDDDDTSGDDGDDHTGATGDDGDADGDPLKFDIPGADPDAPGDEACQKVDLLFVIDDSGSMGDNQQELVAGFPAFISQMRTQLDGVDGYHVGVVTTDGYAHNAPTCTGRGHLVVQTGGEASSNTVCGPYADGGAYMTEQDALEDTFACAGQVGVSGDPGERPIDSIRGALDPINMQVGACNEGFLRDDALLVIVVITDEDDVLTPFDPGSGSTGDPPQWFAEIAAHKGGIETNVVFLALLGNHDVPNDCDNLQAAHASRLIELAGLFTHGFLGDVCADDYGDYFRDAIDVIDSACSDFSPPG